MNPTVRICGCDESLAQKILTYVSRKTRSVPAIKALVRGSFCPYKAVTLI